MKTRIALNILLGISILFFPWWVSFIAGLTLLALHKAYEVVVWGLLFDALYGTPLEAFHNIQYLGTLVFFALFLLSIVVKKKIIFYQNA